MKHRVLILFLALLPAVQGNAQAVGRIFRDAVLRIDTNEYSLVRNRITVRGNSCLAFRFSDPDPVCEVSLYMQKGTPPSGLKLVPSGDFETVDSLMTVGPEQARFKVRFRDLINSNFLKFTFLTGDTLGPDHGILELNLLPWTETYLRLYATNDELYIGEEKIFELITNNVENIRFSNDWVEGKNFNYRISRNFDRIRLHILPKVLGRQEISMTVGVKVPYLGENGEVLFHLPEIHHAFYVRQSRLQFLDVDRNEVTLDDSSRTEGLEIQLENSRLLEMQKTYRIEKQEEPGGALVAEIFTKNSLTNNRVLCILRVYNYHRKSDGYLYIKDGDVARFITNFDITPTTKIEKISILREGSWTQNLNVHPGEVFDLKIEGVGLHKANFTFEELEDITSSDSLIRGENLALYRFRVPLNVSRRRLELFNYARPTGITLNVREYQEARPFDYLWINYQGIRHSLADLPSTILVDGTIQNLILGSDPDMIDSKDKLYGKQYLRVEITVTGRRNELLEVKTIDNLVICPGIKSPRAEYYNRTDCGPSQIDLNRYFRKKTSSLEIWSQIKIKVSNQTDKYQGGVHSEEFDIILRKAYSFDVEVSFPAGLITVSKPDPGSDDNLGQLSGISIAMIGQFTFYHPDKINVLRPYKIGAGFLALNTFNFSDNAANRDLGLVVLGSLYPTTKDLKLTFPLYFGGGYQLKSQKWFLLIGPGIRIRL